MASTEKYIKPCTNFTPIRGNKKTFLFFIEDDSSTYAVSIEFSTIFPYLPIFLFGAESISVNAAESGRPIEPHENAVRFVITEIPNEKKV